MTEKKAIGRKPKYPLRAMNVDDTFFIEGGKKAAASLSACASRIAKITGMKFKVRTVDGIARCWRIK